ncbi:MAG: hypothetical protein ACYTF9_11790 [Planctomycetota bacterium]|jgi:hypothetical protein
MLAEDVFTRIMDHNELIPLLAVTLGLLTGVIAIVSSAIVAIVRGRAYEATRREIAAYVAEGSISPQDAVALLNSGKPKWEVASTKDVYGARAARPA